MLCLEWRTQSVQLLRKTHTSTILQAANLGFRLSTSSVSECVRKLDTPFCFPECEGAKLFKAAGRLSARRFVSAPKRGLTLWKRPGHFRTQRNKAALSYLTPVIARGAGEVGLSRAQCFGLAAQLTAGSVLKLLVICAFVGWVHRSGQLTPETPLVLSQVAVNLMLPCTLFVRAASTLATSVHLTLLLVPLAGIFQIAVGAFGSQVALALADPIARPPIGWHPLSPAQSGKAIAMSTAAASGVPAAAPVLLPRFKDGSPAGLRELAAACCMYGSSFDLPLMFLAPFLSASAFQRAQTYAGLLLIGCAPLLWSVTNRLIRTAAPPNSEDYQTPLQTFDEEDLATAQLALLTPSAYSQEASDAAELELRNKLALRRRFAALKQLSQRALTPPLVGLFAGFLVGISPVGLHLFDMTASCLPAELYVCLGISKAGIEVLTILAGGTLAVQVMLFAALLCQSDLAADALGQGHSLQGRSFLPPRARHKAFPGMLWPASALEWKILASISAVRFGLVPAATFALLQYCARQGIMPADPVCHLAILVQGTMPPAHDLIPMVYSRGSTRFLGPQLARMLLQLSILAVIPVTLWVVLFIRC